MWLVILDSFSLFHVLFNSIVQLTLGLPLEMVHKFWRVGIVYLGGVVGGERTLLYLIMALPYLSCAYIYRHMSVCVSQPFAGALETVSLPFVQYLHSGSLAHSLVDSDAYLAGASGGVYAMIAAHLANLVVVGSRAFATESSFTFDMASMCVRAASGVSVSQKRR